MWKPAQQRSVTLRKLRSDVTFEPPQSIHLRLLLHGCMNGCRDGDGDRDSYKNEFLYVKACLSHGRFVRSLHCDPWPQAGADSLQLSIKLFTEMSGVSLYIWPSPLVHRTMSNGLFYICFTTLSFSVSTYCLPSAGLPHNLAWTEFIQEDEGKNPSLDGKPTTIRLFSLWSTSLSHLSLLIGFI